MVIFPGSPNLTNLTKIRRIRKGDTGRGQGPRKTSIHADKHYKFVMLIHEAELSESGRERCSKPQCGPRSINGRSSTTSARQRPSRTCARSTQTALRAQRQRRCRQSRTRSLEREFGTWQAEHRNTLLRGVFRLFLFPWPVVHVWEQEHNATCYHVFPVPKGFRALPKGG